MTSFPEWPLATELLLLVFLEGENGDYRAIRRQDFRKPIAEFWRVNDHTQLREAERELHEIGNMDAPLVHEWLELQDFAFKRPADAGHFFAALKEQFSTSIKELESD